MTRPRARYSGVPDVDTSGFDEVLREHTKGNPRMSFIIMPLPVVSERMKDLVDEATYEAAMHDGLSDGPADYSKYFALLDAIAELESRLPAPPSETPSVRLSDQGSGEKP